MQLQECNAIGAISIRYTVTPSHFLIAGEVIIVINKSLKQ